MDPDENLLSDALGQEARKRQHSPLVALYRIEFVREEGCDRGAVKDFKAR